MAVFDLDSAVDSLAADISQLADRGRAALFGACGSALTPLLDVVESATAGKWSFAAARSALALIAEFVAGSAPAGEHGELRHLILQSGPNGHHLDSPWSTYAQDALICIDAALVAASVNERDSFKPVWIFSAMEPLLASLNYRGYDAEFEPVEIGSTDMQRELDTAVAFLSLATGFLSGEADISSANYQALVRDAQAIVPPENGSPRLRWSQ